MSPLNQALHCHPKHCHPTELTQTAYHNQQGLAGNLRDHARQDPALGLLRSLGALLPARTTAPADMVVASREPAPQVQTHTHLHRRQSCATDRPLLKCQSLSRATFTGTGSRLLTTPACLHNSTNGRCSINQHVHFAASSLYGTPDREEATLVLGVLPRVQVCFTVLPRLLCRAASTLLCCCGRRPQGVPAASVSSGGPAAACLQLQEALTMLTGMGNCLPLFKCSRAHLCHAGAREAWRSG